MLEQNILGQMEATVDVAQRADLETENKRKIISIIAGSGAGKTVFARNVERIFDQHLPDDHITIAGDGFHRYGRTDMPADLTHFDTAANEIDRLEALFRNFKNGEAGLTRLYIHNSAEAEELGGEVGGFTEWVETPEDVKILKYEGLHGFVDAVRDQVDLAIAVQPEGPLLWAQFYTREVFERGKTPEATVARWAGREKDYQKFIKPQINDADMSVYRQFTSAFPFRDQIKMGEPLTDEVIAAIEQGIINADTVKTVIKIKSDRWQKRLQDLPPHILALQVDAPFEFQVNSPAEQDEVLREIVSRV